VATLARLNPSGALVEPEAVAEAVAALCADGAADRTGETVVIA
jgi:hypothetical protein